MKDKIIKRMSRAMVNCIEQKLTAIAPTFTMEEARYLLTYLEKSKSESLIKADAEERYKEREIKYKVGYWSDNEYEVTEGKHFLQVFKGSLSDCEAYIRLKENENVDF